MFITPYLRCLKLPQGSAQLAQPALTQIWLPRAQGSASLRSAPAWNPSSLARHALELWNQSWQCLFRKQLQELHGACCIPDLRALCLCSFHWKEKTNQEDQWLLPLWCFPSFYSQGPSFGLGNTQGWFPGFDISAAYNTSTEIKGKSSWITEFLASFFEEWCAFKNVYGGFVCKLNK